jgi:hypothetical protein
MSRSLPTSRPHRSPRDVEWRGSLLAWTLLKAVLAMPWRETMSATDGSGRSGLLPGDRRSPRHWLAAVAAVTVALVAGRAYAGPDPGDGEAAFELGAGVDFTMLGEFDVAEGLGDPAERSDLGPGTLGVLVSADARVAPALRLGAEAGIAIGGLVRTDERYFGGSSDVGSTSTVWVRSKLGWTAIVSPGVRLRVGGGLGLERMAEATGSGSVHLDSLIAGPWAALIIGRGLVAEVHGELHAPFRGEIGDRSGDPDGLFFGAGVRLAYVFGLGWR